MKLSIIIPVYNVEGFVNRCIDSCLEQDLDPKDYEIIIINDGSTDNSLKIAEEYACQYSNITVITQVNKGLSGARNTGIGLAKGEYLWFVDSDDWIEPNVISSLVRMASVEDLDVLCFEFKLVYEDGRMVQYRMPCDRIGNMMNGYEFIQTSQMPPAAWCALYKTSFLKENKLLFFEGILHEDMEFTPRAYVLARRIRAIDKVAYNYFQRTGSIMKSSRHEKKSRDLLTVADSLYSFCMNLDNSTPRVCDYLINKVNFAFLQSLAHADAGNLDKSMYTDKGYYPLKKVGCESMKEKVKRLLANISIRMYKCIYSIAK